MLKRNGWTRSRIALREWMPVIVLMCCTFVFNTSEFIPIGLLSDIAADFGITEARAGLLITVYAWVVALVSLPLMLAVARMECRRLMLGVLGLFIASHVLSGLSSSYAMLMASRIGVACAHAVFWSIVSPLAVRVAPKGAQSAALGLIITGTSIAMIVGLPLGRVIGLLLRADMAPLDLLPEPGAVKQAIDLARRPVGQVLVSPVPTTPTIKNDRIEVGKAINISATRMVA